MPKPAQPPSNSQTKGPKSRTALPSAGKRRSAFQLRCRSVPLRGKKVRLESALKRCETVVPLRGKSCFLRQPLRAQTMVVSVPLRGKSCFKKSPSLYATTAAGFRPLAGQKLFPASAGLQGIKWMFPSPCGAKVVSRAKCCASFRKMFPSPCGAKVVSCLMRKICREYYVSVPLRGKSCFATTSPMKG